MTAKARGGGVLASRTAFWATPDGRETPVLLAWKA
jgi:hypothetical protein